MPNFKDISPRLGAAYDLFGNGKTAVKTSLGRYVNYIRTQLTKNNNPASRIAGRANRTWSDANGDYIPDCDLTLATANGECGVLSNQLFGSLIPTVDSADEVLRGWYNRPYNWQFNVALQQELAPGVSLEFIYFRTWFGNQTVTDDLNLGPEDFDQYSYTVPTNDLLPGGGGSDIFTAPAALYAFHVAVVRVPGAVQLMQTSPAALSSFSWPHEHRSAA